MDLYQKRKGALTWGWGKKMTGNPKMQQQVQNGNSWEDLEKQSDFLAFSRYTEKAPGWHKEAQLTSYFDGSALCSVVRIFPLQAPPLRSKLKELSAALFQQDPPTAPCPFGTLLSIPTFPQARGGPCDHHHCSSEVSAHPHPLQQPEKGEDPQAAEKQRDDDSGCEIHESSFLNSLPRWRKRTVLPIRELAEARKLGNAFT